MFYFCFVTNASSRFLVTALTLCTATTAWARVSDYVSLIESEPGRILIRWGFDASRPYENLAPGPRGNEYPWLKKWFASAPDPEIVADGFSAGSGAASTGTGEGTEEIPAALESEAAFAYPAEMTIELLFCPQRLPGESESGVYFFSPEPMAKDGGEEGLAAAGRMIWMNFRRGVMASNIGSGPVERSLLEWDFAPKEGHWYYLVILAGFEPENRTMVSVFAADLTEGESQMRPVLEQGSKAQRRDALIQGGRSVLFGTGPRRGDHREMRSPPSLWDEIVISEGHLTSEEMHARLAALLKP